MQVSASGHHPRPWADQHDDEDDNEDLNQEQMEESSTSSEQYVWDLFGDEQEHDVDIANDEHVETQPKAKRARKTHRRTQTHSSKGKRLRQLETGMTQMQEQIALVLSALGRQSEQPACAGALRADMPWPAGLPLAENMVCTVPGDGCCLWHSLSLCKGGEMAQIHLPQVGYQMREEILGWMGTHQQEVGNLLGCEAGAVDGMIQLWRHDWADARALIIASYLNNVSVLVMNVQEGKIEVFHAAQDPILTGHVWAVRFGSDHYDMIQTPSRADLDRLRQNVRIHPWKTPHMPILRGGFHSLKQAAATLSRRRAILMRAKRHEHGEKTERKGRSDPTEHALITWNMGGFRSNSGDLQNILKVREPLLMAIQETRLGKDHVPGVQKMLNSMGYGMFHGPTPAWGKNAKGQHVLKIADTPGLAFIYHQNMHVAPYLPHTEGGKELVKKGTTAYVASATARCAGCLNDQLLCCCWTSE